MQHTIKKLPHSELEIECEMPFGELENFFAQAAQDLSGGITIPGFRPGKAPLQEVRKYVSEFSLIEKASGYAVADSYAKVIEANNIEAIGNPSVEVTKLALNNPLLFKIKVSTVPDIKLPDWKKIAREVREKEKVAVEVSDKELEEAIRYIRQSRRTFHAQERPCQNGDRVEITFEALENGVPQEGVSSKNHPLILGEAKFLPGFEEALIGMKKGETKDFTLQVPSDWWQKTLSGKTLSFHVTVDTVEEIHEPELNDDLARSMGGFENSEMLRKNIAQGIREEKEAQEKERVQGLILEVIRKKTSLDLPVVLISSERERLQRELQSSIERVGVKLDEYIARSGKTKEEIEKELEEEAEKRVAIGFILRAIAKEAEVILSDEEVQNRIARESARHSALSEGSKNIDHNRLKEYIKGVLKNEKALQLFENC